jgi:S-adenosylmethionine-diacylgycerolhomoserine-N-methlytransferase
MTAPAANHTALMDQVYRRQRYIYDLTRKYYLLGRDRLIAELGLPENAAVVEVGCGTARNLIQLARRYPTAQLYGLDASSQMLETATAALARAGLADRVTLRLGYAEDLTPAMFGRSEPFDAVLFPYSLSMIPDWKQALRSAAACLGPNGRVHIVDFGDLGRAGPFRSLLRAWLRLFHVEPREGLLQALEGSGDNTNGRLRTLFGRYAFLYSGTASALIRMA